MRIALLILLYVNTSICFAQMEEIILSNSWLFRQHGAKEWMKATVPGTVHTDLLANKKIPNPFLERNELEVQWVDTVNWEYQTTFTYQKSEKVKKAFLRFEGLDTYARVYLNDSLLLTTDNMFRHWEVDCTKVLKKGNNTLSIQFSSAVTRGKEEAKKLSYTLPGDEKVFTRKAGYHYGWDWGPRFVTCGIWQPVKLLLQNGILDVTDHHILQQELGDQYATLQLNSTISPQQFTDITIRVFDHATNLLVGSSQHAIKNKSILTTIITIPKPKRWWCNGQGDPHLYTLRIEVENKTSVDKIITLKKIGLRTIELVQEPDSIGKSFYFKLNGKAIFMKGANYIPPDNFLPRVTPSDYQRVVKSAKDANMNMLRVWGGGVYADDAFYEACDEQGILVWQDFMFACVMYPGDTSFIENVRIEAEQQIQRLRHHASLAMWCGNNEVSEAWHNWGWQKQYNYSKKDSTTIWHDYLRLFEEVLPKTVSQLDPSRPYWPSSPQHGWGRKESMQEGDSHYWGIWWGLQSFDVYNKKVGRFMSEYGFQGMPSALLFEKITGEKEMSLQSPVVLHHQKHPTGFQTIDHSLQQSYNKPQTFEDYRYVSQLVQAEGMKMAIEAHRRNQPYCMGTLYWQLNDCWPVTSWSSIDSYGTPKAAHFSITKAFEPIITSITSTKSSYEIFVVSDHPATLTLTTRLYSLKGETVWTDQKEITFTEGGGGGSQKILILDSAQLLKGSNPAEVFLHTTVSSSDQRVHENYFYFVPIKEVLLQKPSITWTLDEKRKTLHLTSNSTLAKNVFLDAGTSTTFAENFFDLIPHQTKVVRFNSTSFKTLKQKLVIRSVYETYAHP